MLEMVRKKMSCCLLCMISFAMIAVLLRADPRPPVAKDTLPADLPIDKVPLGLPDRDVPKDNPLSAERIRLGRQLFFDRILSADQTVACASCHSPEHGFAGAGQRPPRIPGPHTPRKPPSPLTRPHPP